MNHIFSTLTQPHRPGFFTAACLLSISLFLAAPNLSASAPPAKTDKRVLQKATGELPESHLLDVSIRILNSGIDEENPGGEEKKGVFEEVRRSESRFIPVRLMNTLQSTGYWGAVRIVPQSGAGGEVTVSGTILKSNGYHLKVEFTVQDATGRVWFKRKYKEKADARAYRDKEDDPFPKLPFQDLYNREANDMLKSRKRMKEKRLVEIRNVADMKFARDFVPTAFNDYLTVRSNGRLKMKKLPAEGDPMMDRVLLIRERDRMFIDTLTEHYANFQTRVNEAYHNWRKFSFEEEAALREIRRKARTQQILGALLIAGAILADGNSDAANVARQGAMMGGQIALQQGLAKGRETQIHREALQELAASFDAEVEPILMNVEGHTRRLQGSVDEQYKQWRGLLKEIFLEETGTQTDPNQIGTRPADKEER